MDSGLPEILRQQQINDGLDAAHEGDSALFCRLCLEAIQAKGKNLVVDAMKTRIDTAYIRYAITIEQWGKLHELMGATSMLTPPNRDSCVYPTEQTKLNQKYGIE